MVVAKNIVLNKGIVSMDCYINGKEERHFYLEFNISTKEILKNTCTDSFTYVAKVRANIIRTLKNDSVLPTETCVAWY